MTHPSEESDFPASQRLQSLVRLKRHEAPPPGFFRDFAPSVIRRIEREDRAAAGTWWSPSSWLPRLAGANGWLLVGAALLGVSAVSYFVGGPEPGDQNRITASATTPGVGLQLAGPGVPNLMGFGNHGPTLLRLDPAVLRPVQLPGASNGWSQNPSEEPSPSGLYRVNFAPGY